MAQAEESAQSATPSGTDENESIKIRIKTIRESDFFLTLNRNSPIEELRTLIENEKEYSPERQRLIFRGRVLKDGNSIASYSIKNGDTLHLIVRKEGTTTNTRNDEPPTQSQQQQQPSNAVATQQGMVPSHMAAVAFSVDANSLGDNPALNHMLNNVLSTFSASGSNLASQGGVLDLRSMLNPDTSDEDDDDADNNRSGVAMDQSSSVSQNASSSMGDASAAAATNASSSRRAPNPLLQISGEDGQSFSPVHLLPAIFRSCRAMGREFKRMKTNYKAVHQPSSSTHPTSSAPTDAPPSQPPATASSAASTSEAAATAAALSRPRTGSGGTQVEVHMMQQVVTDDNMDPAMSNLLSSIMQQQQAQGGGVAQPLNGVNPPPLVSMPPNAQSSANNGTAATEPQQPRRRSRRVEHLGELLTMYEDLADFMVGSKGDESDEENDDPDTEMKPEKQEADEEEQEKKEKPTEAVPPFMSHFDHVVEQLSELDEYVNPETKTDDNIPAPTHTHTEESIQQLQSRTHAMGGVLVQLGTVLASMGHSFKSLQLKMNEPTVVPRNDASTMLRAAVPMAQGLVVRSTMAAPNAVPITAATATSAPNATDPQSRNDAVDSTPLVTSTTSAPQPPPPATAAAVADPMSVLDSLLNNMNSTAVPPQPSTTASAATTTAAVPTISSTPSQSTAPATQGAAQPNPLGGIFDMVNSLMANQGGANSGGNSGGGAPAGNGLAGLLSAFSNMSQNNQNAPTAAPTSAAVAPASNATNAVSTSASGAAPARRGTPDQLIQLCIRFLIASVSLPDMVRLRRDNNWEFLSSLYPRLRTFVLGNILGGADSPMRRHEVGSDLSVAIGSLMVGRFSAERRDAIRVLTANHFRNHCQRLLDIILDNNNGETLAKSLKEWGAAVLSEWIYKLSLNYGDRIAGVKTIVTHIIRHIFGANNLSSAAIQSVPDFVSYFVELAHSFHVATLQKQYEKKSPSAATSSASAASLSNRLTPSANEAWATALPESERDRWLESIRYDSHRIPAAQMSMRSHAFSAQYQPPTPSSAISAMLGKRTDDENDSKDGK